jgi:beta-phosphoglucomutase-like phosphatase (HAD superfamily)
MKLIIFDIDGTLTSTSGVDNEFLSQILTRFTGLASIDTNWENYPSFTDTGIAEHIVMNTMNRGVTQEEADQMEVDFMKLLRTVPSSDFQQVQGAADFLKFLIESPDYEIAIATGSWKLSAEHKLGAAGVPYEGVPIATCNDFNVREDIMRKAEERAFDSYGRTQFDETLYFGDGIWDVRATRNLKWRMVGIGENIEHLKELGAEHVFENFRAPAEILAGIEA